MPAVQHTQLCGPRPSYWEQISPAGLNSCTEALENIVKPYLDTRLADSAELNCVIKQFFILKGQKLTQLTFSHAIFNHSIPKPCLSRSYPVCVEGQQEKTIGISG